MPWFQHSLIQYHHKTHCRSPTELCRACCHDQTVRAPSIPTTTRTQKAYRKDFLDLPYHLAIKQCKYPYHKLSHVHPSSYSHQGGGEHQPTARNAAQPVTPAFGPPNASISVECLTRREGEGSVVMPIGISPKTLQFHLLGFDQIHCSSKGDDIQPCRARRLATTGAHRNTGQVQTSSHSLLSLIAIPSVAARLYPRAQHDYRHGSLAQILLFCHHWSQP